MYCRYTDDNDVGYAPRKRWREQLVGKIRAGVKAAAVDGKDPLSMDLRATTSSVPSSLSKNPLKFQKTIQIQIQIQ